jgi:hypothetical protein
MCSKVSRRRDAGDVHAALVRERVAPDVGLVGVGREVEQLVDEVRGLGQRASCSLAKQLVAELQLQVGDDRDQVGVAGALAEPLIVPWTWRAPTSTAASVFATPHSESLWQWIPSARPAERRPTTRSSPRDLRRQRASRWCRTARPLGARLGAARRQSSA